MKKKIGKVDEGGVVGSIKFGKFIPAKTYKVDFTADEKVMDKLAEYGLRKITEDKDALVDYAINSLLIDMVESKKKKK